MVVSLLSHPDDGAAAEEAQKIIEGLTERCTRARSSLVLLQELSQLVLLLKFFLGKKEWYTFLIIRGKLRVEDVVRQGDEVTVRVREIDSRGRINPLRELLKWRDVISRANTYPVALSIKIKEDINHIF